MSNNHPDENEEYYVIKKDYFNSILGAKLDPKTECFYDYHDIDDVADYDKFQIGQTIKLDNDKGFVIVNSDICDKVVGIVKENDAFYEQLETTYGDLDNYLYALADTKEILNAYIKDRMKKEQSVDLYVFAILNLLSKAMGLRLMCTHGSYYDRYPVFKYPEELYEVFSAMYNIISERLEEKESLNFLLYDYGYCNEEFKKFIAEIERRTRYKSSYFKSDLVDKVRFEKSCGSHRKAERLSTMKPSIIINPSMTIYYHDIASKDGEVEKITPEEAEKKYESILESQDRDDFDSEKNLTRRRLPHH